MPKAWIMAAVVAGTTLGAGIFSLPYLLARSGYAVFSSYVIVLAVIIITVHIYYFKALETGSSFSAYWRNRRGAGRFMNGFVVAGLFLSLIAYLILGSTFLQKILPSILGPRSSILVFWLICSAPFLLKFRRLIAVETLGTAIMFLAVTLVIIKAPVSPAASLVSFGRSPYLPFGAVLFALSGWSAVEPAWEITRKSKSAGAKFPFIIGTAAVAVIYILFAAAVVLSGSAVSPDTISGLSNWPVWLVSFLSIFALFAIWTSYLPIGYGIEYALVETKSSKFALALVIVLPIFFVLAGIRNFFSVIEFAGGVFLAVEYIAIIVWFQHKLRLGKFAKVFFTASIVIFALGALHQILRFLPKFEIY